MVIAALLVLPTLVIEESNLADPWPAIAEALNWTIWLAFLTEFIVMMVVVPRRREWLRKHPIDIAVVFLTPPFAPAAMQAGRVLRIFRLIPLLRLFSVRGLLSLEGIRYAALVAAGTVLIGGAVFAEVETEQNLTTWDGIWWAATTVTTVGYGDISPTTDEGRAIAMTIMFAGIGFVALLTAFIADRFIHQQQKTQATEEEVVAVEDQILTELREIRERIEHLERR